MGEIGWWWFGLCAAAAFNILAWSLSAAILRRRRGDLPADAYPSCRLQLLLSAGYVFGCAFRSVLPVYDVPRLCLFDSWISSVIVGRSVATVAELCFVAQWALMLREVARPTGNAFAGRVARSIVPMIAIAEVCSWYSVLTTSNIGHVFEESLWGLSAALMVASLLVIRKRCHTISRPAFITWCLAGSAYVAYMFLVDVPRYWFRWAVSEAGGRHYLSIAQGILDASQHRLVSFRWEDWKGEVVWMSLYFSVAVWLSISLIHLSLPRRFALRAARLSNSGSMRIARS
jgi:hypothetical protein